MDVNLEEGGEGGCYTGIPRLHASKVTFREQNDMHHYVCVRALYIKSETL